MRSPTGASPSPSPPGYLRGEYQALGVDFDRRNDLFDEAIEVILGAWDQDDYAYEGSHLPGQGTDGGPEAPPAPPDPGSVGTAGRPGAGVARYGNGWSPFPAPRRIGAPLSS